MRSTLLLFGLLGTDWLRLFVLDAMLVVLHIANGEHTVDSLVRFGLGIRLNFIINILILVERVAAEHAISAKSNAYGSEASTTSCGSRREVARWIGLRLVARI
jgi:hypothetical protein